MIPYDILYCPRREFCLGPKHCAHISACIVEIITKQHEKQATRHTNNTYCTTSGDNNTASYCTIPAASSSLTEILNITYKKHLGRLI